MCPQSCASPYLSHPASHRVPFSVSCCVVLLHVPSVVPGVSLFADGTGPVCSGKSADQLTFTVYVGINTMHYYMDWHMAAQAKCPQD